MKTNFFRINLFILILFYIFLNTTLGFSKIKDIYAKKNISSYFYGLISLKNDNDEIGLDFLKNVEDLKDIHDPYLKELTFAFIKGNKVQEAINTLKKIDEDSINFYEANLLLGVFYISQQNYKKASKKFNLIVENKKFFDFEKLIAKILLNYSAIFEEKKINDTQLFLDLHNNYKSFVTIQEAFINSYLDNDNVDISFLKLINSTEADYDRYVYFYVNYLVRKNRYKDALYVIEENTDVLDNNLLLDQTKHWLKKKEYKKIVKLFSFKNPKDIISEFFYLISNLYASEQIFDKSNFYLNLSFYLNPKFISNNFLLAENYFNTGNFKKSEKIYKTFNKKNQIYYSYSLRKMAFIKSKIEGDKSALEYFEKKFNALPNPMIKDFFEIANFYKRFEKYEESITYYTKVLELLDKEHPFYPLILYRRGGSYERIGKLEESDEDLLYSLKLYPNDPYVLNYLAYSWLERNYKLDESMKMLLKAYEQEPQDPYIVDSVGWAYFMLKKYVEAEKYIRRAVQLMPEDPIVNDHYADILWKLNRKVQANYFWKYTLTLENIEIEMKKKIKKKLIFGLEEFS